MSGVGVIWGRAGRGGEAEAIGMGRRVYPALRQFLFSAFVFARVTTISVMYIHSFAVAMFD